MVLAKQPKTGIYFESFSKLSEAFHKGKRSAGLNAIANEKLWRIFDEHADDDSDFPPNLGDLRQQASEALGKLSEFEYVDTNKECYTEDIEFARGQLDGFDELCKTCDSLQEWELGSISEQPSDWLAVMEDRLKIWEGNAKPTQATEQTKPIQFNPFALGRDSHSLLHRSASAYTDSMEPGVKGDLRNAGYRNAGHLYSFVTVDGQRLTTQEIFEYLRQWNLRNNPQLRDDELMEAAKNGPKNGTPRPDKVVNDSPLIDCSGVDLSNLVDADTALQNHQERITQRNTENKFDVYSMPGFVAELMKITLDSAPYPNKPLAFCGALSLLSLVVARRVSFDGLFPNLYLLGLAASGSGKDQPRKVNNLALESCEMSHLLGDAFASGEGLEDAMFRNNAMLFQCDEFDSIVRSMANERESRFESITERLLRFYSSSSVTYALRQKANDECQRIIKRPHLSLFATCVPSSFIDSISKKMTTSGLLARMIVVNGGKREKGKRAEPIAISESIKNQIRHWQMVGAENGNLTQLNPVPLELETESNAAHLSLDRARIYFDEMYDHRFDNNDEGGMAIWARAYENTCKLAILYACSQNAISPQITKEGVEWARGFVGHHVKAMLKFVDNEMSESPFDKLVNRIKAKIGQSENGIDRSELLRFSKVDRKDFDKVIDTLISREEVVPVPRRTKTRNGISYLLA